MIRLCWTFHGALVTCAQWCYRTTSRTVATKNLWLLSQDIFVEKKNANCSEMFNPDILLQDAKNGAEIKAVDAYCWLHSTVHLDTSLMRKLNTLPKVRDARTESRSADELWKAVSIMIALMDAGSNFGLCSLILDGSFNGYVGQSA